MLQSEQHRITESAINGNTSNLATRNGVLFFRNGEYRNWHQMPSLNDIQDESGLCATDVKDDTTLRIIRGNNQLLIPPAVLNGNDPLYLIEDGDNIRYILKDDLNGNYRVRAVITPIKVDGKNFIVVNKFTNFRVSKENRANLRTQVDPISSTLIRPDRIKSQLIPLQMYDDKSTNNSATSFNIYGILRAFREGQFSNRTSEDKGHNIEWQQVEHSFEAFRTNIEISYDLRQSKQFILSFQENTTSERNSDNNLLITTDNQTLKLKNQELLFLSLLEAKANWENGTINSISLIIPTGEGNNSTELLLTPNQYVNLTNRLLTASESGRRYKIFSKYTADLTEQTRGLDGSYVADEKGIKKDDRRGINLLQKVIYIPKIYNIWKFNEPQPSTYQNA